MEGSTYNVVNELEQIKNKLKANVNTHDETISNIDRQLAELNKSSANRGGVSLRREEEALKLEMPYAMSIKRGLEQSAVIKQLRSMSEQTNQLIDTLLLEFERRLNEQHASRAIIDEKRDAMVQYYIAIIEKQQKEIEQLTAQLSRVKEYTYPVRRRVEQKRK